jgi:hypothetical protein
VIVKEGLRRVKVIKQFILLLEFLKLYKVVSLRKTCGNFPGKSCAGRVLKIFTDHRECSSCFHRSEILALNLKVNKNENFLAPILKFLLFHC